jgi:hypothetical protein
VTVLLPITKPLEDVRQYYYNKVFLT